MENTIKLNRYELPDGSYSWAPNRTDAIMGKIEVCFAQKKICLLKLIPGEYIHPDLLPENNSDGN